MAFFNINFQRVGWLLRQEVTEHWKTHLRYYLGLQVGFLIALVLFLYNALSSFTDYINSPEDIAAMLRYIAQTMGAIGVFTLICSFIFSASAVFTLKNERGVRTVALMLPATTQEKVFTRFLLYNVGSVFLTFIALCLTDIFGFLVVSLFGYGYMWFTPETLSNIGTLLFITPPDPSNINDFHPMLGDWTIQILPIALLLMAWSMYLWGGAFFRKKSFIMTSALCFIAFVLLSFIFGFTILHQLNHEGGYSDSDLLRIQLMHQFDILYTVYWALGVVWFSLNLYFGYRIRQRASLIPRRWFGQ